MKTYIQDWLGSRLGIVVDLSPEHFGRHTKDGILLAKLLYSYGAIPLQILNSIEPSKNVNDCYNNLKVLKPWLEYLEVPVKDDALYEVASGQGTAAIHLFYALYLSLQHKDKLYHLSSQKEMRYSEDCNKRQIKVDWVPEKSIADFHLESETELAEPLVEKQYMIKRHREKCNEILEKIKSVRENYLKSVADKKTELGPIISRHASSKRLTKQEFEIQTTENDIKMFDEKHSKNLPDLNYEELIELQNQTLSLPPKPVPNFTEARGYMNYIKQKSRKGIIAQTFQEEMQKLLVDELCSSLTYRQEASFEEIVCKNLLKQSQYEKQMCTKLALIRRQKDVLVKNRQIINNLNASNIIQKEYDDSLNYKLEIAAEDAIDEEFERQRLLELHKRMYIEKVRLKFRERLEEAKNILGKFIDIAVRICEFREVYNCEVPKHLMKDLKELFFKDLPIFDILENVGDLYKQPVCGKSGFVEVVNNEPEEVGEGEEEGEEEGENDYGEAESQKSYQEPEEECGENEEYDSVKAAEFIRQEVLNECDFNDYLFLLGPWMVEGLLLEERDTEESQVVLGYIVHKMLECKYPLASVPLPAEIKPMYPRGIVQGSSDETAFLMLSELLALRKILVVRVDDAINYVLRAYKDELSAVRDIDITFQQATKYALKGKGGTERTKESTVKEQLLKKEVTSQKRPTMQEPHSKEVSTQTPRKIPDDDPLLTPNAEIGKSAFESLGIGDPVPDITVISAIIAYVVSLQEEYDGWVLWNYPVLYAQASKLEFALTGYQLISIDDEMDTVEGLEGFGCRSNCQHPYGQDEFAEKRVSRLVPKPEGNTTPAKAVSYFTSFVKLRKKNGEITKSNSMVKAQGQDCIEKFYSEQQVFYSFEYSSITFQTVKDIAKAVLGEASNNDGSEIELVPKSSLEIFGEDILALNEKYSPPKKKGEKEAKKPVETPKKGNEPEVMPVQNREEEMEEDTMAGSEREMKKVADGMSRDAKPGDADWDWATGDQPEEIQSTLASFWENMETVYIEDFKYVFFCLRVHRANVVKYKAFLKKALQNYLRREDVKQSILNDFQHKFNDIDDDLRPDCDVKCELHVRVSELEEVLLEIADDRREKSESYRVKFINDNWVAEEMCNLVNLYIRALQLEADRCLDTCQFANDYYLSLQQKLPSENVLQKVYAPSLQVKEKAYSVISTISKSFPTENVTSSLRDLILKSSKSYVNRRSKHEKRITGMGLRTPTCSVQHEVVTLSGGTEAINEILVNLSFSQDSVTPFHQFFIDTLNDLKNNVRETVENCLAEARKGTLGNGGGAGKDKKKTAETKVEGSSQLYVEWMAVLENELSRFLYRMRLIQTRGIADFNEFIFAVVNTLTSLSVDIGTIYNREVHSISECCKVFRCAIEQEIAVQPRLELNVDEFAINHNFLLYPNSSVEMLAASTQPAFRFQFTIEQLTFMHKKLQFIAPDGEIIRRAFLYILEDLRVMKSEDGKPRLLPDLWDDLNPNELPFIFDRVYQRIEIVNWKDFIVYALELPMPSEIEILAMRSTFRSCDQSNTELISYKDFIRVDFWFENYNTRFDNHEVKDFLFTMYQVDEEFVNYTALLLAFCKDSDPIDGFLKALVLSMGKRIIIDEDMEDANSQEGEQEEVLREEDDLTRGSESVQSLAKSRDGRKRCKRCVRYPCQCKDPSDYQTVSQMSEEEGEGYGLYLDSKDSFETMYTSDIPGDVIKKVLLASYPALPQLSILLGCKKTFEQTVDGILESLSLDGTTVRISKLLKNKVVLRILNSTNKFKAVDMQNIVKSIVEERQGNVTATCSVYWS